MSRNPLDRAPAAGLAIPVVAIAAAIGIGAYLKRDSHSQPGLDRFIAPPSYIAPRVTATGSEFGKGIPKNSDGSKLELADSDPHQVAYWFRCDLQGAADQVGHWPVGSSISCADEKGRPWPHTTKFSNNAVFVLIPRGYSAPPKKLDLTIRQFDRVIVQTSLAGLPKFSPAPPPPLSKPWPGVQVEACRLLSDPATVRSIYVDAPLPAGNVLAARIVGTSASNEPLPYSLALKGPDAIPYLQIIPSWLAYPDQTATAYVEISELAPTHISREVTMGELPVTYIFGMPWLPASTPWEELAPGVLFSIRGHDVVPVRPPRRARGSVNVEFAMRGLSFHGAVSLIEPTSISGVQIQMNSLESGFRIGPSLQQKDVIPTAPIHPKVRIDADVYHVVRKATVAVDLRSPRVIPDAVTPARQPTFFGQRPTVPPPTTGITAPIGSRIIGSPGPAAHFFVR